MQSQILIKEVFCGSSEYLQELNLRNRILRVPLGMNLFEELGNEADNLHICALLGERVVGTAMLIRVDEKTCKVRQVSVEETLQRQSIGRQLMVYAEERAQQDGFKRIVLNARKTAVGFYQKLGYQTIGEEFIEVGLPHYPMVKEL